MTYNLHEIANISNSLFGKHKTEAALYMLKFEKHNNIQRELGSIKAYLTSFLDEILVNIPDVTEEQEEQYYGILESKLEAINEDLKEKAKAYSKEVDRLNYKPTE